MKNCCICKSELVPFEKIGTFFDCTKCMIWYFQDEIAGFNFEDGRCISNLLSWELTISDDLNGSKPKQKIDIKIPDDIIDAYYNSEIQEYNNKIYEFLKAVCSNLEFI